MNDLPFYKDSIFRKTVICSFKYGHHYIKCSTRFTQNENYFRHLKMKKSNADKNCSKPQGWALQVEIQNCEIIQHKSYKSNMDWNS